MNYIGLNSSDPTSTSATTLASTPASTSASTTAYENASNSALNGALDITVVAKQLGDVVAWNGAWNVQIRLHHHLH